MRDRNLVAPVLYCCIVLYCQNYIAVPKKPTDSQSVLLLFVIGKSLNKNESECFSVYGSGELCTLFESQGVCSSTALSPCSFLFVTSGEEGSQMTSLDTVASKTACWLGREVDCDLCFPEWSTGLNKQGRVPIGPWIRSEWQTWFPRGKSRKGCSLQLLWAATKYSSTTSSFLLWRGKWEPRGERSWWTLPDEKDSG